MAKRALVVGINDYRNWKSEGFADLSFCRADASDFATLLTDAFGFDASDVTLHLDAQVTSKSILDGLRSLLSRCDAGDVACFYYSGHGDSQPLPQGALAGAYVQTIVPYNGPMISNNEITSLAQSLEPSRINFTIVLDSCFSGGLYDPSGGVGIRSRPWTDEMINTFVQTCRVVCPLIGIPDISALLGNVSDPQPGVASVSMSTDSSKDFSDLAKATLLSACNFDESAGESGSVGHGYFTKAILDVVNQSGFLQDHPTFLQSLRGQMSSYGKMNQTPQLRGRPVRLQENFLSGWNYSI